MLCRRCNSLLEEGSCFDFHGTILCEECYFYETNPPKACDPFAVSSALSIRKQSGQFGIASLSELQKRIYHEIEKKGKLTKEQLLVTVGIKPEELDQEFAILRHCELVRAFREGNKIYLTKW